MHDSHVDIVAGLEARLREVERYARDLERQARGLERQNADLQAANNRLLERARGAELVLARASLPLTFAALRSAHLGRDHFRINGMTLAQWACAMASATGLLCEQSLIAGRRVRSDSPPGDIAAIRKQVAAIVCIADRIAARFGIDLAEAVARHFNAASEQEGAPQRLAEIMPLAAAESAP